jgi:hypothetical protein
MRRLPLVAIFVFSPCLAPAATPTADALLAAMDEVLPFDTRTSTATMEVIDARRIRSYRMKTYARGQDSAGRGARPGLSTRGTSGSREKVRWREYPAPTQRLRPLLLA